MTMASVKVAVRVRPFNQRELDMQAKLIVQMDGKKTRLHTAKNSKEQNDGAVREKFKDFTFDYSYWSYDSSDNNYASQEQVFSDLGVDVIDSAFEGYNACVFAYGQTGSGKTFTMMGSPDNQGLIPRICRQLFSRMAEGKESGASYRTEVSYLEIYNEKVKDLLGGDAGHSLRVREHPKLGPYVQDLSKHLVSDYDDIQECMHRGNLQRTTASTQMNDVSSRSHAIFTVTFVQASYLRHNNMPSETASKVHLVDLAGSERADATGATGQRLVEGAHINKSLVTLGSVISALAESSNNKMAKGVPKKQVFIPYRDSVLTWLLKDSLGGNSKTIMIAAISPADCNYGETLSTLRYANRAKNIINKPTINEDPNVKLIRELREEIDKLRAQITTTPSPVDPESAVLATLQRKEAQEKVLTEKWTEKWRETQQILQEQKALGLRKSGLGVVLDSDMPHLVGIDDNLLSTGVTLYHLKEGETIIGSGELTPTPDIVISGAGVLPLHCTILLRGGEATLRPAQGAHCWLNTVMVDSDTKLSQGCIILLGRTNMFRYNDPAEAAKLRQEGGRHLNLSRLSLLSWSTTELHASDNAHCDFPGDSPDPLRSGSTERLSPGSEVERSRLQARRRQRERELSWRAEREQLLQAQRQLDEERAAVEATYAAACRRLSSSWSGLARGWTLRRRALKTRQAELRARGKRLKALADVRVQHANSEEVRVAELQAEVDARSAELEGYVRAAVRELVAKGCRIDESDPSSPTSPTSESSTECLMRLLQQCPPASANNIKETVDRHKKEIVELEEELQSKMATVSLHRSNIERLQAELDLLAAQEIGVQRALSENTDSNGEESDFSPTEGVKRSKSELVLRRTTKEALEPLFNEDIGSYCAYKMNLSLSLDPLPSPAMTPDETFHTASSTTPKGFPSDSALPTPPTDVSTNTDELAAGTDNGNSRTDSGKEVKTPQFKLGPSVDDSDDLSSTEDYHKPRIIEGQSSSSIDRSPEERQKIRHRRRISEKAGRRQVTEAEALRAMQRLCSRIAAQKMLVISSLEDDCSKEELNAQIAVLQDLQKKYVRLEMALQYSFFDTSCPRRTIMVTPIQETPSLTLSESDMQVNTDNGNFEHTDDPLNNRLKEHELEGSDNVSTSNDELHETWEHPLRVRSQRSERGASEVDDSYRDDESLVSTIDPSPGLAYPVDFSSVISIPGWVTRGAGAATHHEFEVRVSLGHSRWLLLRRYRRFRELRIAMRNQYGHKVSCIPFPPRQLWSSEGVARARRPQLEAFLRRLLAACAADPACALHRRPLTRDALVAFSPFFRKGVFESGKCGTG